MPRISLIIFIINLTFRSLIGQITFPDLVTRAFGTDQELVNGIQFSNHYGRFDGHPYFLDGRFREGSVSVNNGMKQQVMLRYNLYSQRVEIEYRTIDGNLNQYMSVPELITSFTLEGHEFIHMQLPGESPGYYLAVPNGEYAGFIEWKKDLRLSKGGSARDYEFTPATIFYWIKLEGAPVSFHSRRGLLEIFPARMRPALSRLLKKDKYSFKHPSVHEAVEMVQAVLEQYETENRP
jgi:hypothetical protein